jgi:hypothetical protein
MSGVCSTSDCSREVAARGLCIMHYKRVWRRTGPIVVPKTKCGLSDSSDPLGERFWRRVNKTENCWEWACGVGPNGYGYLNHRLSRITRPRLLQAHRISYELNIGQVPAGMIVCHKCDNRICVRPDHLFVGTYKDNMQDMLRKGRGGMRGKIRSANRCQ